jgi:hypothetical protein
LACAQGLGVERLEPHEEAAEAAGGRPLQEAGAEHGVHRARRLPEASHAAHPVEERRGEAGVSEQVVVEEVEVPAGKPVDLRERLVHPLDVEGAASLEERVLVAEAARVGAAPRDDERVGHEVALAAHEVAARGGEALERAYGGAVDGLRATGAEVGQEARPRLLPGAQEDRVGVGGRLLGPRGHVEPAEGHMGAAATVLVGEAVGTPGRRDVDLDCDEVGRTPGVQLLDVLVLDPHLVPGPEVAGERRQAERREEGVLDGPEEGALRLGEGGQDQLDPHRRTVPMPTSESSRSRGPSSSSSSTRCQRPS